MMMTDGQVMSWYHSKMLRIPHGKQNPTKRYIDRDALLELCTGEFLIQEKVDGKLSCNSFLSNGEKIVTIQEDMTNKNTCHNHVMNYTNLPANKRIDIDVLRCSENEEPYIRHEHDILNIAYLNFYSPTIELIMDTLESFARQPSKFGAPTMEGIVIKNYKDGKLTAAKYINEEFEDRLK